jgi:starch synthase
MTYVCDRGSTHVRHQHDVLVAEHQRWGLSFAGIDPRIIEREEAEYAAANMITVPSAYVKQTFVERGVPDARVSVLPYGVDLERFQPVDRPGEDSFDLLFVGGVNLRKGAAYLLQAFHALEHPRKTLTIAGVPEAAVVDMLWRKGLMTDAVQLLGHVPQAQLKQLMSRSHALVLPSVEEGLAMVMAQAMACGCPVVATHNTGATDLYADGVEGYIVGAGDAIALTERLQHLADAPEVQRRMSAAALRRVQSLGGWATYGDDAMRLYCQLAGAKS